MPDEKNTELAETLRRATTLAVERGHISYLSVERLKSFAWESMIRNEVYYNEIFNHDFAQCFFGNEKVPTPIHSEICQTYHLKKKKKCVCGAKNVKIGWQDHLRKMVLEKEPILYLEKFMREEVNT